MLQPLSSLLVLWPRQQQSTIMSMKLALLPKPATSAWTLISHWPHWTSSICNGSGICYKSCRFNLAVGKTTRPTRLMDCTGLLHSSMLGNLVLQSERAATGGACTARKNLFSAQLFLKTDGKARKKKISLCWDNIK